MRSLSTFSFGGTSCSMKSEEDLLRVSFSSESGRFCNWLCVGLNSNLLIFGGKAAIVVLLIDKEVIEGGRSWISVRFLTRSFAKFLGRDIDPE